MAESEQVNRRARRRHPQAGKRLKARINEALEHARDEFRQPLLELTEQELEAADRACTSADRAEELGWLYDEEMAGERRASVLTKISSEIRLCDRQVVDLLSRIKFGVGEAKSERHAYSANQRWHREGSA